jgi:hypothetical protein
MCFKKNHSLMDFKEKNIYTWYRLSLPGRLKAILSDRRDQIGIGDDKENKKHVLGARRVADKAALDHAFRMRA